LVARNGDRLREMANQLTTGTKRSVEVIAADLTSTVDLAKVETAIKQDSSISLLVNNAGFGGGAPLLESDVDKMEEMIDLNVTALTRLTYAAVPGFVARGRGTIVNISSLVAIMPELLNGVYGGTKAYVMAFTRSLNHELAGKGIRVQAVLPGSTASEFWNNAAGSTDHEIPKDMVMSTEELVDAALAGLNMGELFTIPSLPNMADFEAYEKARGVLLPNLSRSHAADRYGLSKHEAA
jgi:uncharacterized protein